MLMETKQCKYMIYFGGTSTEVITIPEGRKPIDNPYYRELCANGVLMQDFLKNHPHGQLLEEMMQRVSLMCPIQHNGNPAYLVPSVAPFMQKGKPVENFQCIDDLQSIP